MTAGTETRWGISIPQHFIDGPVDMGLVQRFVSRAEALKFHSLWVQERAVGSLPVLEPISLLCYAAALTTKAQIGCAVFITPLHNPAQFARLSASLDQMSGGRLIVGVGLGSGERDYPAFGIPAEERVKRLIEGLDIMKALWTQPSVTFEGEFWQLKNFKTAPKPIQKPHPPIWFGAHHPAALKRAVRHGDGWMGAGASSTAEFKESVPLLRTYLEQAQRDPATFPISKRVYIAVDRESARAEQRIREFFGAVYGNPARGSEVAVYGNPAECVEQLGEVLSMEPQLVLLSPVSDYMEQMELLAQEVIPKLK